MTHLTLEFLKLKGNDVTNITTKDMTVFAQPDAPSMDFIITSCDQAAGQDCPVWQGQPITAH